MTIADCWRSSILSANPKKRYKVVVPNQNEVAHDWLSSSSWPICDLFNWTLSFYANFFHNDQTKIVLMTHSSLLSQIPLLEKGLPWNVEALGIREHYFWVIKNQVFLQRVAGSQRLSILHSEGHSFSSVLNEKFTGSMHSFFYTCFS